MDVHGLNPKQNKTLEEFPVLKKYKEMEFKKKWKKLAINHHPDKLISQGVPEDLIQKNTSRLKEINNAWDIIQNQK